MRVHCDSCGLDRVVPFFCKGRGFCPRHADAAGLRVGAIRGAVGVRRSDIPLRRAHD
jgi:hypothetical protein